MSSDAPRIAFEPVSSEEFRRACGRFATGIAVASVMDETDTPHGLTVSSFAAVSLEPPLILISLGHAVTRIEEFRSAQYFGLSFLNEQQRAISDRFARKGHDRFEGVSWQRGETGVPLLAGALATIECSVWQRVTAGDHDIFIGEVVRASAGEHGQPLLHYASHYRKLAE